MSLFSFLSDPVLSVATGLIGAFIVGGVPFMAVMARADRKATRAFGENF